MSSLAADLEIAIGRTLENNDVLAKTNVLADIRSKLSKEDGYSSKRELKIVGMYCALLVLSKAVPSSSLRDRVRVEMSILYRDSFTLRGGRFRGC